MKNTFSLIPLALAAGLSLSGTVEAATFEEASYGDFAHSGNLQTLQLEIGGNTVSGSFGFEYGNSDFDSFAFAIPAGSSLQSIVVTIAPPSGGNTHDLVYANWAIRSGSSIAFNGTIVGDLTWNAVDGGTYNNELSAGIYNLTNNGLLYSGPFQAVAKGNYTLALNVTAVPEPEIYGMMMAGLGLIGLHARRRKLSI